MSKKKARNYKILIIDDDLKYVESLVPDAEESCLELKSFTDLESAKKFMENSKSEGASICGIILDVVCMNNEKQEIPQSNFIMTAMKYFQEKFNNIPLFILTGEPEEFKKLQDYVKDVYPIYSKGRDETKMLLELKEKVQKIPREKIIRRYLDVFEVVEQNLGFEEHERLLDCLNNMTNPELSAITGTLVNIRKLQESLYLYINKINKEMIPQVLIYNGDRIKVDNEKIIRHLKGNYDYSTKKITTTEYIKHNSQVDRLLNYIYKGCSEEIHVTEQDTTKYTVQSLVFAFMDLVILMNRIARSSFG